MRRRLLLFGQRKCGWSYSQIPTWDDLLLFFSVCGQKALSDWATCYRLASTMLFEKRQSVHDVTIFGAGKQAYWHARLALLLRGEEIHHMNFGTSVPSASEFSTQQLFSDYDTQ